MDHVRSASRRTVAAERGKRMVAHWLSVLGSMTGVWAAAREVLLISFAIFLYFGVRGSTEGKVSTAHANAGHLRVFEQTIGLAWEHSIQKFILAHDSLITLVNWVYIYGHWPVILVTLAMLYLYRPRRYQVLRNAMFISGAIGFAFFYLLPVAPPRFVDPQTVDTVTIHSVSYRLLQPPRFVNLYAAMPSLHAGWNLIVGVIILGSVKHRSLRLFAIVMPVAMAYAVVATGNHYVLDVVVGILVALIGLGAAKMLDRRTSAIVSKDASTSSGHRARPELLTHAIASTSSQGWSRIRRGASRWQ